MIKLRTNQADRSGVASIELAVCLPILVIVAFVAIEACGMLYLAQSLKIASFEGARVGVVPLAETDNVVFQCETLLDDRAIQGYTISLDPSDPALLEEGDYFRVTINVDYEQNALIPGFMLGNRVISRSTALRAD